ncbi:MAG: DUF4174 domain-containing protein [Paracoccaceae bacterium]
MRKTASLAAALMIAAAALPAGADNDPMEQFLWSDRPIIIFAPSKFDQRMLDQIGRFSMHRKEYRDRDIKVIQIGGVNMRSDGRPVPHAPEMRERYDVAEDEFTIILVGKDGGEKLRLHEVTDPRVFYDLIDSMPMRQQEMRREVDG